MSVFAAYVIGEGDNLLLSEMFRIGQLLDQTYDNSAHSERACN